MQAGLRIGLVTGALHKPSLAAGSPAARAARELAKNALAQGTWKSIRCGQQTIEWRNCGVFRKSIFQIEILWSRDSSKYHLEQFIIFRIRPYFYAPIMVIRDHYLNIFRNTISTDDPAYPREIHLIVVYLNGKRRIGRVPKRRAGLGHIRQRQRPQPPMTAAGSRIVIDNSWISVGISHRQGSVAKNPMADKVPPGGIHGTPRQARRDRREG